MPSDDIDRFVSDYLGAREERVDNRERAVWQGVYTEQAFRQKADDPTQMNDFYENDPRFQTFKDLGDQLSKTEPNYQIPDGTSIVNSPEALEARQDQFVQAVERAYANDVDFDLTWYMQWSPEELEYFMDGTPESKELVSELQELQEDLTYLYDRQTDEMLLARQYFEDSRSRYRGITGVQKIAAQNLTNRVLDQEPLEDVPPDEELWEAAVERASNDFKKQSWKNYQEQFSDWKEQTVEQMHLENVVDYRWGQDDFDEDNQDSELARRIRLQKLEIQSSGESALKQKLYASWGDPWEVAGQAGLNALGATWRFGAGFIGGTLATLDSIGDNSSLTGDAPESSLSINRYLRQQHQEELDAAVAHLDAELGLPDGQLIKDVSYGDLSATWQNYQETRPDIVDEYMVMAGFDPSIAFALFFGDAQDALSAEEQMQNFVEQRTAELSNQVQDMREQDYRIGDALLTVMASYGRNIPGRVASWFAVLTDGIYGGNDIYDILGQEGFVEAFNTMNDYAEAGGLTPSGVLGIDGSLAGLMTDLVGETLLDPVTWIFGPSGRASGLIRNADDLARVAKSPVVRAFMDDIVTWVRAPNRGGVSIHSLTHWMDDSATLDLLDEVIPYQELDRLKSPGNAAWKQSTSGSKGVQYLDPEFYDRFVLDAAEASGDNLAAQFQKALEANKGYVDEAMHGPAVIYINKETGEVAVKGDIQFAVRAAKDADQLVPTRVRVLSDEAFELEGGLHRTGLNATEVGAADDALVTQSRLSKAGDDYVRPDYLFARRELFALDIDENRVLKIVQDALGRGAVPKSARTVGSAAKYRSFIEGLLQSDNSLSRAVGMMVVPAGTVRHYSLSGPNSMNRLLDSVVRLWGHNTAKADDYIIKIFSLKKNQRAAALARKEAIEAEIMPLLTEYRKADTLVRESGYQASKRSLTEKLKNQLDELGEVPETIATRQQLAALREEYRELSGRKRVIAAQLDEVHTKLYRELEALPDNTDLVEILDEMWDDFNRTEIAPKWSSEQIGDDGLVPWETLTSTKSPEAEILIKKDPKEFINTQKIKELEKLAEELSEATGSYIDPNKILKLSRAQTTYESPLTVLDAIGAATLSGRQFRQFAHSVAGAHIKATTHTAHLAYIVDKVFKPATAMVVSLDELMRIWHRYGYRAAFRWLQDKTLGVRARAMHALRNRGNPLSKHAVPKGGQHLSQKSRDRLTALAQYPSYLRQAERRMYEGFGMGWVDIDPSDANYHDAARTWFSALMEDTGFRAFLRGEDEFFEWFHSIDAEKIRNELSLKKITEEVDGVSIPAHQIQGNKTVGELYRGYQTYWNRVMFSHLDEKTATAVRKAIQEHANKIDELGGSRILEPEDFIINNLGPVRGYKRTIKQGRVGTVTQSFFDRLFMDPVNYRRGYLAELVRAQERKRLERLFHSQGRRIVSDAEIDNALGIGYGLDNTMYGGLRDHTIQRALDSTDFVPESYVDDLIERAVEEELENVMYAWDRSSRAGAAIGSGAIFPFGKPWADMASFWMREFATRPALRGLINEKNLFYLRSLNNRGLIPNLRTPAMMSRLAHTDFQVDRGFYGEEENKGLFPGAQSTDFSPMLFLPTGGDNPFGEMLPGFGFWPMFLMDQLWLNIDPIENPLEYQRMRESIADFIPGIRFGKSDVVGDIATRVAGGGLFRTVSQLSTDFLLAGTGQSNIALNRLLGDVSRELDRNRVVSAFLASPEFWEDLETAENIDDVISHIDSYSSDTDTYLGFSNAAEDFARFLVPASNKIDGQVDVVWDVWAEASELFPQLQVNPDINIDALSGEQLRDHANDVREAFFSLPRWRQNAMIAKYPALAVNMVSSWTWTRKARELAIPGAAGPYRVDGSREGLALHQNYIQEGFVEPLTGHQRIYKIVQTALDAKRRAHEQIYVEAVEQKNDEIWENEVTDREKGILQEFLDEYDIADFGPTFEGAKELWSLFGVYVDEIWEKVLVDEGVEPTEEAIAVLKDRYRIRTMPWSTTFPGTGEMSGSRRFKDLEIDNFSEDARWVAGQLGVQLTPGMNGQQLLNELRSGMLNVNPITRSVVNGRYATGSSELLQGAEQNINDAINNPELDNAWREDLAALVDYIEVTKDRYEEAPLGVPSATQQEINSQFVNIVTRATDYKIDWPHIWDSLFARDFGPLGWQPYEPRAPRDEEGNVVDGAWQPYVRYIVDGDSFAVAKHPGANQLHQIRLLGVRARDYGIDDEGAVIDKRRLRDALQEAEDNDEEIWLVRDPNVVGNTDIYGRELAWLWIGDEPFYFEDEMQPNRDESSAVFDYIAGTLTPREVNR